MELEKILEQLCIDDPRNPDYIDYHEYIEDNKQTSKECFCDNCFCGRTKLAEEILRLRDKQCTR